MTAVALDSKSLPICLDHRGLEFKSKIYFLASGFAQTRFRISGDTIIFSTSRNSATTGLVVGTFKL